MRVEEIARLLGGKLQGDGTREIRGVASLESAGPGELAFAEGERALARAAQARAGCIVVVEDVAIPGQTTIGVRHPKWAFIRVAEAVCAPPTPTPGVHPTALVAADAKLGPGVRVEAHVVIERGVIVDRGTRLGPGTYLGEGVQVGAECILYPRVTVYPGAKIGSRVILHAGVVVGSDGFGYVFAENRQRKFPQLGKLVIEDEVEIGSNTTLDRGSLGVTIIGEGTKIDNLVQIAHNVKIGRHCVIAAQTGISGSVVVGDRVVMGGQVGIGDHARIEDEATLGGGAGILPGKIVRRGSTVWGRPSRPLAAFKRQYAYLSHLPDLAGKVEELSRRISAGSR